MATQLRDYRIVAGALDEFVSEWRAHVAPLRTAHGFSIDGAWTVAEENRFVWLVRHAGDWDEFRAADERYHASPARRALQPDPARLIERQSNVALEVVPLAGDRAT